MAAADFEQEQVLEQRSSGSLDRSCLAHCRRLRNGIDKLLAALTPDSHDLLYADEYCF
jgi:hypothetical protein